MENEFENELNYSHLEEKNNKFITEPNFFKKKIMSRTMKNINELSLKNKRIQKYSINLRNEFNKKMEKRPKLFEKQIYSPLYIQIHKSLRDINKEIKISQQYIIPNEDIRKGVKIPLIYSAEKKENNKLTLNKDNKYDNNYMKYNNNFNDYNYKIEKSKSTKIKSNFFKNNMITKTYSGNIQIKKNVFRNQKRNKTLNKNSSPPMIGIDSYKGGLNRYLKLEKINGNDYKYDSENKSNYLTPTHSNSPYTPLFPKKNNTLNITKNDTNSNDIKNKNLKLNLSNINRTLTNSSFQEKKKDDSNGSLYKEGYKTYFVEYDADWYFKNKFIKNRLDKNMIKNPLFQKKIIDDELALLFENMKIFQSKYLVDKSMPNYFNKISWYTQKSLNIHLEEAIGLLNEISYLLLDDYDNIIQNFISNPIQRIIKRKFKKVYDEKKEFITNISTFSETFVFLQVCYESYNVITTNKEEYFINSENFEILYQYLDRARFIVSKICLDLKNMYKDQVKEDKKIIDDCLKKIKNVNRKALINNLKIINNKINNIIPIDYNNNKNDKKDININKNDKKYKKKKTKIEIKVKSKVDCHQRFGLFNSGINSFRYKGPKQLKLSEEHLTNLRINKAFIANSTRDLKPNKHFARFDINSKLVNQLMKYATKEFKSKIISERIRQRFIISESAE